MTLYRQQIFAEFSPVKAGASDTTLPYLSKYTILVARCFKPPGNDGCFVSLHDMPLTTPVMNLESRQLFS